ncbi:hypothetical protein AB0I16_34605 [Streptomyces sp. NPDC050703]|uniref:hypothetical protein n=1 Tax=Streptomyces sp. NPDC050703 TaxID=3157218 RepID=UPI00342A14DC
MEGWQFWWGIAAFFLGGLATQLNGWLAYRRQRKDKADDAADALTQRSEEFELQHLMEVNQLLREAVEELIDYSHAVHRYVHLRDTNSVDESAEERREQAGQASQTALANAAAQVGFILADSVREAADAVMNHIARANTLLHGNGSLDVMALSRVADLVHERIGARVREIYASRTGAQRRP